MRKSRAETPWFRVAGAVAVAVALSIGLFAGGTLVASPAEASTKSFSSHKYGSCGAYKTNAAAYISTYGSVTRSSDRREITLNKFTGNFISFRCNTQYHSSVDRMRTGLKFVAYGTDLSSISVGWKTGYVTITSTLVDSKYFWGSWRNNTANTVTTEENNYVKGKASTSFSEIDMVSRGEIEHNNKTYSLTTKATVKW